MAHNPKHIDLEAYLDGELTPEQAKSFADALAADPELQAELDSRLADRQHFQLALGEDIPALDIGLDKAAEKLPVAPVKVRRLPLFRVGIALAACLCLAILTPRMLRNNNGIEGPDSQISISGQVTVIRYGETPGVTTVLEAGAIELPAGLSR